MNSLSAFTLPFSPDSLHNSQYTLGNCCATQYMNNFSNLYKYIHWLSQAQLLKIGSYLKIKKEIILSQNNVELLFLVKLVSFANTILRIKCEWNHVTFPGTSHFKIVSWC